MRQFALSALLLVMFTPLSLSAETPDPSRMFEKGYVNNSLGGSVSPNIVQGDQKPQIWKKDGSSAPLQGKEPSAAGTEGEDLFVSPVFQEQEAQEEPEEKFLPIQRLSLFINASTADEAFRYIKQYTDTLSAYDLTPEALYTMQIPPFAVQDAPTDWVKVIVRGGEIRMNRKLAEAYGIERVPTWLARTSEGDVILEGYEDISGFLNSRGELRRTKLERLREEEAEEELNAEGGKGPKTKEKEDEAQANAR